MTGGDETLVPSAELWLVRHAEQSKGWDEDADPSLSSRGQLQAKQCGEALSSIVRESGPIDLFISSPLSRSQQTLDILLEQIPGEAERALDPRFAELPSPGLALNQRQSYLMRVMQSDWKSLSEDDVLINWRQNILQAVRDMRGRVVVVSHFMVINTLMAWVQGSDAAVVFSPTHCSVSHFAVRGQDVTLLQQGGGGKTFWQ